MKTPALLKILTLIAFAAPVLAEDPVAPKPDQISVNLLGSLRTPGRMLLPKGANILDALAAGGGETEWSDLTKVLIIHRSTDQKPETTVLNVQTILSGVAKNYAMHDGDTVNVPKKTFRFK